MTTKLVQIFIDFCICIIGEMQGITSKIENSVELLQIISVNVL